MTQKLDLLTSHEQYEALHDLADKRTRTVRVDRDLLLHLLMDHSNMLGAIKASTSITVNEPTRKRTRIRAK